MAVVADFAHDGSLADGLQVLLRRELGSEQVLEEQQHHRQYQAGNEGHEVDLELCGLHRLDRRIGVVHNFALRRGGSQHQGVLLAFLQQEGVQGVLDALLAV